MSFNRVNLWEDRFIQGFMAGVIGWLAQTAFTLSMYALHISKFLFLDFAGALGFAKKPHGFLEILFAEAIVAVMQGAFGAILAMLIKSISSVGIIFKGGLFGGFAWATISTISILYRLKPLYPIDSRSAFVILSGSVIWGAITAWVLLMLNRKLGVKN